MSKFYTKDWKPGIFKVKSGKYAGVEGEIVQSFPLHYLMRTEKSTKGGRFQPHYNGWIIKVKKGELDE